MPQFDRAICDEFFTTNDKVKAVFEKKDGTERIMTCTRNLRLIPEEFHPKSENPKPPPEGMFPIFDIKANGWRSFAIERLKSLDTVE